MKFKVLIAEDEKDIVDLLKLFLEKENLEIIPAYNGEDAWSIMESNKIDLAVLDIMMPKLNGFELTKKIRSKYSIPIIILSAKQMDSDKILGLDLGADDYITKPFNPLEVLARIKSQLRRSYNLNINLGGKDFDNNIKVGELLLDQNSFKLTKNDTEIILTPTEFKIIHLLMKSPGRVYTKSQIFENIRGDYFYGDDNTLMVYISKLREKIEDNPKKPIYIKTVRGLGYKIEKESNITK
ncbi:response regulator transcription factor [Oceanirhabdus seepicola]|uniref:Stage 0 sporulation protein A homolog n=1 Tax=Oceanirhabdus seepicola TaxID=2828781 RepID=A0A9J6P6K4_9CLOT|nr:response regulator transcription factor [Oceanirhabdus seepicola]MCM1992219.1 response regulator transcription factor [Oceanirhabdus seepicola]